MIGQWDILLLNLTLTSIGFTIFFKSLIFDFSFFTNADFEKIKDETSKENLWNRCSLVVIKPNFNNLADSQGVDDELPRSKDQKKIQIEIKRNIPRDKISDSTVRRSIRDPQTVLLARKKGLYFYFPTFPVGFWLPNIIFT